MDIVSPENMGIRKKINFRFIGGISVLGLSLSMIGYLLVSGSSCLK